MSKSFTGAWSTNGSDTSNEEFNEFARIQELEPAILHWLRETFQVFAIADLANLSVNRVFSQATDEGKLIARSQIEHWIMQAQSFTTEQPAWKTSATFVVSLQSRQVSGQTEQRTITYCLEADRKKIWPGIEFCGVVQLILDQLQKAFHLRPNISALETPKATIQSDLAFKRLDSVAETLNPLAEGVSASIDTSNLDLLVQASPPKLLSAVQVPSGTIEFIQFRVLQTPEIAQSIAVDTTELPSPISLKQQKPFDIEVTFQLTEANNLDLLKDRLKYIVEFYGRYLATGETKLLGKISGTLDPEKLIYACHLRKVIFAKSDLYRLRVITRIFEGRFYPGLFEVPVVQVV